jgi:hypothetical protein
MTTAKAPTAVAPATDGAGRNVVILGWVSFWGGLSQDMILPILPALPP